MTRIIFIVSMFILTTELSACRDEKPVEQNQPVELTDMSVSPASLSFVLGVTSDTQQITVTATPEDAADVSFAWSSNNTSVADVSQTGLVTATGVGKAQISVTANEQIRKLVPVDVMGFSSKISFQSPVYLQNPATDGMTVIWLTNISAHSWVECGTDSLDMQQHTQTVDDGLVAENSTVHRIRLTGLTP